MTSLGTRLPSRRLLTDGPICGPLLAVLAIVLLCSVPAQAQSPSPVTTIQNDNGDTRLQVNVDGGLLVPGAFGSATPADSIPTTGQGTRLMWYPAKAAVRAGRVFDIDPLIAPDYNVFWDPPNVGDYSAAFGVNTKASGIASMAAGNRTEATGEHSVAIGGPGQSESEITSASGEAAIAMGSFATASGDYSVAMNRETRATAEAAVAMGNFSRATAFAATAVGLRTTAATANSLTIGASNDKNRGNDDSDPFTGPLFVAGNGTPGTPSDALVLYPSGDMTISGSLTESSDRRLKSSIQPLGDGALQKLSRLRPVRFQFKNQSTHPAGDQIGLIAQDVQKEFPALVSGKEDDHLSLSYSKLTAVLIKGMQEQQSTIDSLEQRLQRVEKEQQELAHLKERMARLESETGHSFLAGLTKSGTGLLAVLVVGLLGAGLFVRRRL
ncbi:tail fiber domain-containing protein [Longibacter salinarum]|nr:tail fiber domain-containing protein [Longibacter salinarum]